MYKNLRWKLIAIAAIVAIAVWTSFITLGSGPKLTFGSKLKLGLDLKGGVHLVYRVETDAALRIETETASEQFLEALKSDNITGATAKVMSLTEFEVSGVSRENDAQFREHAIEQLGRHQFHK